MPLAMGRRRGDAVECGYHGITFNAEGRCIRVPSHSRPSEQMRLKRYPVVERWQWVWIWTGDPDLADPALLPDHPAMGLHDDWEATPAELYPVAARYPLLIENLLDLSHISFLHGSYIEDDAWFETPVKLTNDGARYIASRHSPDSARSAFHAWMFPDAPPRIDQELRTVFLGPSLIYSGPVMSEAATDGRNGRYLGTMFAIHALTPETPHSTHYFSTTTRDFRQGDAAMTQALHEMDMAVRMQDVVALGAIEQHLQSEAELPPEISVPADTPALHIRRIVDAMIGREMGTEPHG
jgi:vanillate O-demethylase monooxygenase subunit